MARNDNRLWRDIIDPDVVKAFDVLIETEMEIVTGMERIVREILKDHLLDIHSKSYFTWLLSTIQQMRSTIEKEFVIALDKYDFDKMLPLPKKKRKKKGGG